MLFFFFINTNVHSISSLLIHLKPWKEIVRLYRLSFYLLFGWKRTESAHIQMNERSLMTVSVNAYIHSALIHYITCLVYHFKMTHKYLKKKYCISICEYCLYYTFVCFESNWYSSCLWQLNKKQLMHYHFW